MLVRVEIIANRSVEEDLLEQFSLQSIDYRTVISPVHGVGECGPCLGDNIWPEENSYILLFVDEKTADIIGEIATTIREQHRGTGLSCFISRSGVTEL